MRILALDTTMAACSVAIVETEGGCVLAEAFAPMQRGHAEALAPMVRQVMDVSGIDLSQIDRVAVTTGPGTFTGIRIGLAMARGLGLAASKPVIGIDTLRAIATNDQTAAGPLLVAADARKGEVYTALYDTGRRQLRAPGVATVSEASADLPIRTTVIGTGASAILESSQYNRICRSQAADLPVAARFAALAATLPATADMPSPLYLRVPDAKPQVAAGPKASTLHVEEVTANLAPVLAGLHAACFPLAWTADAFRDILAMPGTSAVIASQSGSPLGFVVTRLAADEAEIITIGTLPSGRRRGLARALLEHQFKALSEQGARRVFIEVAQSNTAARALYGIAGFSTAGFRKNYYELAGGGRDDAIIMRKDLAP